MYMAQTSKTEIVNLEHLLRATITPEGTTLQFVGGTTVFAEDVYGEALSRWLIGASLRPAEEEA